MRFSKFSAPSMTVTRLFALQPTPSFREHEAVCTTTHAVFPRARGQLHPNPARHSGHTEFSESQSTHSRNL